MVTPTMIPPPVETWVGFHFHYESRLRSRPTDPTNNAAKANEERGARAREWAGRSGAERRLEKICFGDGRERSDHPSSVVPTPLFPFEPTRRRVSLVQAWLTSAARTLLVICS